MLNRFCILSKVIFTIFILFTFLFIYPTNTNANNIIFQDVFDDNLIGTEWDIKNYDITDNGSFGNEHPLSILEHNGYIEIFGKGNNNLDWYGRSLITEDFFVINKKVEVESDITIPTQINGSAVNITIEFDQNNRIVLTLGQIINNSIRAAHLAFEENSILRLNNDEILFEYDNDTPLNLKLTFDPSTKQVDYYIGNIIIDHGIFKGSTINNPHVGIAAIVRDEYSSINAHFDNFKIFQETPKFELPFYYENRLTSTQDQFNNAFNNRLTAAFDHTFRGGLFTPFTGVNYGPKECKTGQTGITCYDSHNGIDFDDLYNGQLYNQVYSVTQGKVIFTSDHNTDSCIPNAGGFGCVVVVEYPLQNVYGLYAHLQKISVNLNDSVDENTVIGEMGKTGCPSCGKHLHFGVMQPIDNTLPNTSNKMSKKDWGELLYTAKPTQAPRYPAFCSYRAPNNQRFAFQDTSGWSLNDVPDPWSLPRNEGGCNIISPYLWRYSIK